METIKICDRCGAEIDPASSVTEVYAGNIEAQKKELCISCAFALREWLSFKPFPKEEK